jgi:hypothetical protein
MKNLTEADVLRVMREEWNKKIAELAETIDLTLNSKIDGDEQLVLSPELKVMHKNSGIRYTISSVGPRDVILRTPEGENFIVDKDQLEQDYELD